jgi:hypothetical protein
MGRCGVATVSVMIGALALMGCGGGDTSSGNDSSNAGATATTEAVPLVTVGNMLGLDEACSNTVDLLSISAQMISGQVAPDLARETIARFLSNVPDEISADATIITEVYLGLIDALEKHGGNMVAAFTDPEAMEALERLDTTEVNQAGERLNAFLADKCNLSGR